MQLPPLRERREDLPGLARMFLKRFAAAEGIQVEGFSQAAMEAIAHAEWPGNVRQLENTIHRAVVMTDSAMIRPQDLHGLSPRAEASTPEAEAEAEPAWSGAQSTLDQVNGHDSFMTDDGHIKRLLEIEAEVISRALKVYRGRMSETARRLGIGRSTLYRKIDEMQLDKRGI